MIALGGAIGAGLFVGTGAGIKVAGPGVLISFALASGLAVLVMRMLGEMAAAYPSSGAFSVHAEKALGPWAGFTVGWLYWSSQVVVLAVEASGAAHIATGWLPAVPQWAWVLLFMGVFTTVNLIGVRSFGEFEFWFAGIKVFAIVAFLVLGGLAIIGLLPGTPAPGLSNLTAHDGFLPHGWQGVVAGLLIVLFAFGGIEVVTIAAAEAEDPARSVGRAIRSSVLRIVLFYLGSLTVAVTLLPWNDITVGTSPYVAVLERIGVPAAGDLMSVVVFLALLSALNATLYAASRMIFSLAERGEAPRALRTLSGGVPRRAVLASTAFGFVSVLLNLLWPDTVFLYLLSAVGAVLLLVWGLIALSQLRLRRRLERDSPELLTLRMWGFPYLTWLALAAIVGIAAVMATDPDARTQLISAVVLTAVVLTGAGIRTLRLNRSGQSSLSTTNR
jgi:aromatic amino acid permease